MVKDMPALFNALRRSSANPVVTLLGWAALALTGAQVMHTAHFLRQALRTSGVVVEASAHPRVRFTTAGGRPVEFIQNGFLTRPRGSRVDVGYLAQDPRGSARALTFWTTWGVALWSLPMGLGFTLLPLLGHQAEWRPGRF